MDKSLLYLSNSLVTFNPAFTVIIITVQTKEKM